MGEKSDVYHSRLSNNYSVILEGSQPKVMLANESQEVPVNLVCDICLNRAMHCCMAKQSCVLYVLQRAHAFINKTNLIGGSYLFILSSLNHCFIQVTKLSQKLGLYATPNVGFEVS